MSDPVQNINAFFTLWNQNATALWQQSLPKLSRFLKHMHPNSECL